MIPEKLVELIRAALGKEVPGDEDFMRMVVHVDLAGGLTVTRIEVHETPHEMFSRRPVDVFIFSRSPDLNGTQYQAGIRGEKEREVNLGATELFPWVKFEFVCFHLLAYAAKFGVRIEYRRRFISPARPVGSAALYRDEPVTVVAYEDDGKEPMPDGLLDLVPILVDDGVLLVDPQDLEDLSA
ncbi:hypothetical protein HGA91_00130 [candidate division WWE3 bacterium]|nr:hypothetical protein [candidate division WWE3 bacterium]